MFVPLSPEPVATGWFDWGGQTTPSTLAVETKLDAAQQEMGDARAGDAVVNAVPVTGTGLVATLRNVFVPTPNPDLAPAHPADPLESSPSPPGSAASSTSSLTKGEKKSLKSHHLGHKHNHEDYINTLEISTPENASSREAVVVMHGYAAALG